MKDSERVEGPGRTGGKHHHVVRRYWEIVNLYPKISDPELAARIEEFTLNATPEQLFGMQKAVIEAGTDFMVKDPLWKTVLEHMDGRKIGLAIGREYQTTVSLENCGFTIEMGIADRNIPVLSVASRKDYADALLRRKDIVRMLMTGRLKATHKLTLARWGLSFLHLLNDESLFEEILSHQTGAEKAIAEKLNAMKY